jgi:hypothetical protein
LQSANKNAGVWEDQDRQFFLQNISEKHFLAKRGMVLKISKTSIGIFFTRGVALEDQF